MNGLVNELRAGGGLVSHVTEFVTARRAHSPMMVVRWVASVSSKAWARGNPMNSIHGVAHAREIKRSFMALAYRPVSCDAPHQAMPAMMSAQAPMLIHAAVGIGLVPATA